MKRATGVLFKSVRSALAERTSQRVSFKAGLRKLASKLVRRMMPGLNLASMRYKQALQGAMKPETTMYRAWPTALWWPSFASQTNGGHD